MKEKHTIPKEFHDKKIAEGFSKGDPSSIRTTKEEDILKELKELKEKLDRMEKSQPYYPVYPSYPCQPCINPCRDCINCPNKYPYNPWQPVVTWQCTSGTGQGANIKGE